MDLPSTLTDALAALSAAQADVAALNALSAEHTSLVANFEALKSRTVELSAALELANANNLDLAKALDTLKASEADASAKANAIVANLGVAPVTIHPEQISATKSTSELWAEYNSLPIQARNAFYAQHKAALKLS
jgi:orotidine-5'-phosphate decarboxylase